MPIKPRIETVSQVTPYFGHLPGATATPAGSIMVTGVADPAVALVVSDALDGGASLSSNTSRTDGTWFLDLSFFMASPLGPGRHDLVVTAYPSGLSGPPGESSLPVPVIVGTGGADILYGQVPPDPLAGPGYVFAGPGDDTVFAGPAGANGMVVDGGRETSGGGQDTVVLPIPLADLEAHRRHGSPGGSPRLVLDTPHGTVTLLQVERIAFNDATLTVQSDPLVDFLFYDTTYRDMADADADVRAHYDAHGWQEGRDPNAYFSTRGYLGTYADVKAAGLNPLDHYDADGWREGRDPSAAFDTGLYLLFNPDVAAAGIDPLRHFLLSGEAEGRRAFPAIGAGVDDGFDPVFYSLANPDVTGAGMDPRVHFDTFGWREGRNPDAFFDTGSYLAGNPDVAAAGINPLDHYNAFGWLEGRDPSAHFDTQGYLAAYADVAGAGINPLQHFLQFGAAEGRSGFGDLF